MPGSAAYIEEPWVIGVLAKLGKRQLPIRSPFLHPRFGFVPTLSVEAQITATVDRL